MGLDTSEEPRRVHRWIALSSLARAWRSMASQATGTSGTRSALRARACVCTPFLVPRTALCGKSGSVVLALLSAGACAHHRCPIHCSRLTPPPHPSSFRHRASCRDPEAFDWYQRYAGIKEQLTVYAEKTDRILNLGCGNSRASCSSSSLLAAAALLAASLRVARGTHPTSPISSSPFSPHAPSSPTVRAPARTSPPSSSHPPPLFLHFSLVLQA